MNAKTVELHLIQSFAPSCVNRDGNNSPKDCVFGGVRRGRISSQCLKRAIRQADSFAETVEEAVGTRSKQMRDKKVIPYLIEKKQMTEKEAEKTASEFLAKIAKPDSKRKQLTSVGLYFGDEELFSLLEAFLVDKKKLSADGRKSADVALFGRMLAEATELNVDAAAQVAHALSTHKLSQEMDYWTAADDLKDQAAGEDAGAGMLGTAEFNASVFYRYSCVNLSTLLQNLGNEEDIARKTVHAFLLASYDAIPTGKLNGHAHFNPPLFALAVVRRKGMPLNLANAFLDPVLARNGNDLATASASALLEHLERMRAMVPVEDADYCVAHALPSCPTVSEVETLPGYAQLAARVMETL